MGFWALHTNHSHVQGLLNVFLTLSASQTWSKVRVAVTLVLMRIWNTDPVSQCCRRLIRKLLSILYMLGKTKSCKLEHHKWLHSPRPHLRCRERVGTHFIKGLIFMRFVHWKVHLGHLHGHLNLSACRTAVIPKLHDQCDLYKKCYWSVWHPGVPFSMCVFGGGMGVCETDGKKISCRCQALWTEEGLKIKIRNSPYFCYCTWYSSYHLVTFNHPRWHPHIYVS